MRSARPNEPIKDQAFLADAGLRLLESMELEATHELVAALAVPALADACALDVLDESGSLRQVAVAAAAPERIELLRELREQHVPAAGDALSTARAVHGGASELLGEVSEDLLAAATPDSKHLAALHSLELKGVMITPLTVRGRTIGALLFLGTERRLGPDDLSLAEEYSARAAVAIDNARLLRRAEDRVKFEDSFLGVLAHELRTPLTASIGWVQMLRRGMLEEAKQGRALEAIERNLMAEAKLVDDAVDVARIVSGRARVERRPSTLDGVVRSAVEASRRSAEGKSLTVTSELDRSIGPVLIDPTRIQQVIGVLLSNAIKFTPEGGRVSVRLEPIGSTHARIVVQDSGRGIAHEMLERILPRLLETDPRRTRSGAGLGVGLATARYFVEAHGGVLSAFSEGEGRGSTFTVQLPLASASDLQKVGAPSETRPGV